jgi:hypothetical protein
MTINEFLQKYRKQRNGMQIVRPRVRCADGYTVSVQAGNRWNSEPQLDTGWYSKVELGYPTAADEELRDYADEKRDLRGTVYGFVPVKLVDEVLTKHGGIVGADFSNDGAGFWEGETNDDD